MYYPSEESEGRGRAKVTYIPFLYEITVFILLAKVGYLTVAVNLL